MEIPFSCWACKCHSVVNGTRYCNFVYGSYYSECVEMYVDERHPNCPLVEVPTPHGDLIDKQRIMFELGESTMKKYNREFCLRVLEADTLTPVIIEAEE